MRIFTSILLPEEIKEQIKNTVKGRLPVAYVNTENAHITLNFLGEVSDPKIEEVKKILRSSLGNVRKFNIGFEKLQKFRNQIHLAIKKTKELIALQLDLETEFKNHGFRFQSRPYYPHIKLMTLHMDNIMFKERKIENFPQEDIQKIGFVVDKIILYKSILHQTHAEHMPIEEVALI